MVTLAAALGLLRTLESNINFLVPAVLILAFLLLAAVVGSRVPQLIIVPAAYLVAGVIGFCLAPAMDREGAGNFYAGRLDLADYVEALDIFIIAGLAMLSGISVRVMFSAAPIRDSVPPRVLAARLRSSLAEGSQSTYFWACLAPIICLAIAMGPMTLIHRETYHVETHFQWLAILANLVVLPAVVISAAMASTRRPGSSKFAVILVLYVVFAFSNASRTLSILPLLILMGWWLGRGMPSRRKVFLLVTTLTVVCIYLLRVPLSLRAGTPFGHGLLPYITYAMEDPGFLFSESTMDAITNIFFGFMLTAFIDAQARELPYDSFFTSVSPLPGFMTNWQDIRLTLNINSAVPMNALGELSRYSLIILVCYFVLAGFFSAIAFSSATKMTGGGGYLARGIYWGFTLMFFLASMQYNLRSTSRFAYYILFFAIACGLFAVRPVKPRAEFVPPRYALESRAYASATSRGCAGQGRSERADSGMSP